jgi:multiple sugar transport system permease protein
VIDALLWVFLIGAVALVLVPVAFMFVASFMPPAEIFRSPFPWWPSRFYLENFLHALRGNDGSYLFVRTILNSTVVALSISFATVMLATLTGYSLAKLPFGAAPSSSC